MIIQLDSYRNAKCVDPMQNDSKWLKHEREKMKLTQKELAEKAGINRASYSNVENGTRNPSVTMAKKIAAVVGVEWTRFFQE